MILDFENKTVVITGATGAVGAAAVSAFQKKRANVVAIARDPVKLTALKESSPGLTTFSADVTNEPAVEHVFREIYEKIGATDILIHTVGGFRGGQYIQDISTADWQKMIELNLSSAFLCARKSLQHMISKGGKIVTISAMSAIHIGAKRSAYAVSKAGLIALTKTIAEEGKAINVQANTIAPGIILTEANQRDMPDMDQSLWVKPGDIAETILFLCSPQALTITGTIIEMP